MNDDGIFKSLSSPSKGVDTNTNGSNRNTMERGDQSQQRKERVDAKACWYDWINPRWRDKELKNDADRAISELEKIVNGVGRG
jgi:hypothetical protein